MDSGHSLIRKTFFMVETVYNIINIIFAWFSIVSLYCPKTELLLIHYQGNFYLFFVSELATISILFLTTVDCPYNIAGRSFVRTCGHQVLQCLRSFPHGVARGCRIPLFYGQQTTLVRSPFSSIAVLLTGPRAAWKYKTTSIILSILMFYMMIASIKCAMQASKQGSTENSLILLSVVVTYGGESLTLQSFAAPH